MNIQSRLFTVFLSALTFFALPLAIFACGVSFVANSGSWKYGADAAEQSFIHYENGIEKLIIARDFDNGDQKTVWVIPIPAQPTSIMVQAVDRVPNFTGVNVIAAANRVIDKMLELILQTQLYFVVELYNYTIGMDEYSNALGSVPTAKTSRSDITIHNRIREKGIIAEVLSAENSDGIYEYFADQGLRIDKDSIPILQEYIGKEYAFVASWIDTTSNETTAQGLLMSFPTTELFYPLKPGSVYPGNGLPETIFVTGYVIPNLYPEIKQSSDTTYYHSNSSINIPNFFSTNNGFRFTKVIITANPKQLTQDLTFVQQAPLKPVISEYIMQHQLLVVIVLLLSITYLATVIAVRLALTTIQRKVLWKLYIANLFTFLGTVLGTLFFLKEGRIKYVATFLVSFSAITLSVWYLLSNVF